MKFASMGLLKARKAGNKVLYINNLKQKHHIIPKRQSGIQAIWRESCGAILYEMTEKNTTHRLNFGTTLRYLQAGEKNV